MIRLRALWARLARLRRPRSTAIVLRADWQRWSRYDMATEALLVARQFRLLSLAVEGATGAFNVLGDLWFRIGEGLGVKERR